MNYFLIIKSGASLDKRFLRKIATGVDWTSYEHASRFSSLGMAEIETNFHDGVRIIRCGPNDWTDITARIGPVPGKFAGMSCYPINTYISKPSSSKNDLN